MSSHPREGLKKPFLQKSKPVNTGAPARFLSKKMGFFRGYLEKRPIHCQLSSMPAPSRTRPAG
ncbi:hypothetical protein F4W70_03895 [Pseudomonas cannabina]|nr:hypothetical protein F4W70_03895 [Pseudomonas cannabina]